LIDPRFLRTLPPSELLNGIGEMVKYGVVSSKEIFTALERCVDFSVDEVRGLIKPCCRIKAGLVSEDERDQGVRTILNYGHTVAHALESSSHYRLGHGVSVLIGMLSEGWIAQEMGIFEPSDFERQQTLIKRILNLTKKNSFRIKENQVIEFAFGDKKNFGGKLMMALPERIGTMHGSNDGSYKIEVSSRLLRQSLVHVRSILSPTE
jgi:3-dehydroquinate synthase